MELSTFNIFSQKVQGHIKNLVGEHFKAEMEAVMSDPILFGDYRNAFNETEPRDYEDIQDYESSKAIFEVSPVT